MVQQIKVLIVDDSPLVCSILKSGLEQFQDITVVGIAHDPYEARDLITKSKPDVISLDIEMPKMNGIEFLRHLMQQLPIPVIMVSSLSENGKKITFDALSYGAVDFVTKPRANDQNSLSSMIINLYNKIRTASMIPHEQLQKQTNKIAPYVINQPSEIKFKSNTLVTIGASTGGTEAIKNILPYLPPNFPPVVITQHMPKGFTALFASRLDTQCRINVIEAQDMQELVNGCAYVAPGGTHMGIIKKDTNKLVIKLSDEEPINGHKPSVQYLFDSVLMSKTKTTIAVLLTGMGRDGAEALLRLRNAGAYTIAQNQDTSIVFGMPGEAISLGGATTVLPLNDIAEALIQQTKE